MSEDVRELDTEGITSVASGNTDGRVSSVFNTGTASKTCDWLGCTRVSTERYCGKHSKVSYDDHNHHRWAQTDAPQSEIESADGTLLICTDCEEYHDANDEWSLCPKCGTDLLEVTKG